MAALKLQRPLLYGLTKIQWQYLHDWKHRFFFVPSGRRSRKTLLGKRKLYFQAQRNPGHRYFFAAPAYEQAKKIFWEDLKRDTHEFRSQDPSESELKVVLTNGTEISVQSLDRAFRLEGAPVNGFLLTEYPNAKPNIWSANLRPLLADTHGWAIIDGVPDMHSPLAEEYRQMAIFAAGGKIPDTLPDGAGAFAENPEDPDWCFYSWFSSDVLDSEELRKIKLSTDPVIYQQEYEGSFIRLGGSTYYGFGPDVYPNGNIDNTVHWDKSLPIHIGGDFNVTPMTATLAHHIIAKDGPNKGRKETHVFEGYFLRDSNTESLYTRIVNEHLDAPYFMLTPCQSSRARQTVADIGETDRTIIAQVFRKAGKTIHINEILQNPPIKDRVNLTNARLFHRLVRVNGNDAGLKELVADWGNIAWKQGTNDLDLSDAMRGHISAAFDYSEYKNYDYEGMMRERSAAPTDGAGNGGFIH